MSISPTGKTVAILLYGPGNICEATAPSLLRHVAEPLNATIFHAGSPIGRARPTPLAVAISEAEQAPAAGQDTLARASSAYGSYLAASEEVEAGADLVGAARYLASELSGIDRTLHLMRAHENYKERRFDQVLVIRTDLVFYTPVTPSVRKGRVQLPGREGFDSETGMPLPGLPPLRYFRSRSTGDFVPDDGSVQFSDGMLVLARDDADLLDGVAASARAHLTEGAPPHAATILYLILGGQGRLTPELRVDWMVERHRPGEARTVTRVPQTGIGSRPKRVAVLLYGLLREYKATAGSLLRHVVAPHNASIFYFGPVYSDNPTREHGGEFDERGFFSFNPKGTFEEMGEGSAPDLRAIYGDRLKAFRFHHVPQRFFLGVAEEVCPRDEWLFMLSPHRLLSMFYNMSGAIDLLRQHELETGAAFDEVIITRPDLAFYMPVKARVEAGEIHIPASYNFDDNGYPHSGNAPIFFYKNVADGTYLPAGRRLQFNDQVLYLTRGDLERMGNIYDGVVSALRRRVPASPETILYLLATDKAGLKVVNHDDWRHEIHRAGDPVIKNVADTPEILNIDPRHHLAGRFLRDEADRASAPSVPRRHGPTDGGRHLAAQLLFAGEPGMGGRWRRTINRRILARARRLRRGGDLARAQRLYARFLKIEPRSQREWVQFGHVMKEQGDLVGARAAYNMACLLAPDDPDPVLHRQAVDERLAHQHP